MSALIERCGAVPVAGAAWIIGLCCSACAPPTEPPPLVGQDSSEETVLAAISDDAYRSSTAFRQASRAPYQSDLGAKPKIMAYVTAPSFPWYEKIASDQSGSRVYLTEGAVIVREVLDAKGQVEKLTLMVKGAPNSNPSVGDFWFGVTDPSGTPLVVDGQRQMGQLSACYSCHQMRANDGYLFGVPIANHMP